MCLAKRSPDHKIVRLIEVNFTLLIYFLSLFKYLKGDVVEQERLLFARQGGYHILHKFKLAQRCL